MQSVLNDAIAISLFKVFAKYYNPAGPDWREAKIPSALGSFVMISILSILVGVGLGLTASFVYKHTELSLYPNLETSLLFCFCYLCYATGESLGLSGIMALFFQGMVLSHYNSYNLSPTAHVASEQIFATMATLAETAVFLYMGMGVFTGRFENYDLLFSILALCFCLLGRFLNIFPLSWIANICRSSPSSTSRARTGDSKGNRISLKMQCVLWFAGLRGAVSFALAMNMPGPNRQVYATATLSICIVTTVVCGGLTNHMLTAFGMKTNKNADDLHDILKSNGSGGDTMKLNRLTFNPAQNNSSSSPDRRGYPLARRATRHMYHGTKQVWTRFEDEILKVYFGGSSETINESPDSVAESASMLSGGGGRDLGDFELGNYNGHAEDDDDDDGDEGDKFIN
jgi:solute carrier family 9 (sodium/hydrogen exchanger), member 8